MTRLVVRLLQLARADAGIGLSDTSHDIVGLLDMIIEDSRRDPARAPWLRVALPRAPVRSRIDADAFAMVVGNLVDNAFQHAPPDTPIKVELTDAGVVRVTNEGPVVPPDTLSRLTRRFQRGSVTGNGFGLGLYIAETIARHTGGSLTLHSPPDGQAGGFEARFAVPLDDERVSES